MHAGEKLGKFTACIFLFPTSQSLSRSLTALSYSNFIHIAIWGNISPFWIMLTDYKEKKNNKFRLLVALQSWIVQIPWFDIGASKRTSNERTNTKSAKQSIAYNFERTLDFWTIANYQNEWFKHVLCMYVLVRPVS